MSLAPYAITISRGRKYPENEDPLRNPFQRDRDRIVHSKAFRRLSGKTQVFVASYGDHYRTRLTHSLEVSMVSRDIARALHLNEDLSEAIALAHDLGHTPFAHAGEEAMSKLMEQFDDHFEHNEQSLRVVEILEKKSPDYSGLNLTLEVLEGLQKHLPIVHSLEAQIVDLSDMIAYLHHDLDDGLRSQILNPKALESTSMWALCAEDLEYEGLGEELFRKTVINRLIAVLISDVIEQSKRNFQEMRIETPLLEPLQVIGFGERLQKKVDELYEFLGAHFYLHEKVTQHAVRGQEVIRFLFEFFGHHEELLPLHIRKELEREKKYIVLKDYIAGMTDRFAKTLYRKFARDTMI